MPKFVSDVNLGGPDDRSCVVGTLILPYPPDESMRLRLWEELDRVRAWWEKEVAYHEGETPQPSAHAKHCDGPQCGLIGLPGDDSPWCECDCPLCDESVPVEGTE